MNKLIKWWTVGIAFLPLLALAQYLPGGGSIGGGEAAPVRSVEDVLLVMNTFIAWFQAILFIIAVVMILYAALLFLTAKGDDTKIDKARDILIYAAVGIGVVLLAYAVEPVVRQLLGTS